MLSQESIWMFLATFFNEFVQRAVLTLFHGEKLREFVLTSNGRDGRGNAIFKFKHVFNKYWWIQMNMIYFSRSTVCQFWKRQSPAFTWPWLFCWLLFIFGGYHLSWTSYYSDSFSKESRNSVFTFFKRRRCLVLRFRQGLRQPCRSDNLRFYSRND